MQHTDAYIAGFCKAAEIVGVDPVALYKKAATMQKRAFTLAELGVATALLGGMGYGGYKTVQRAANNPAARTRGAAGAGIGAGVGAVGASIPFLAAMLSRGKVKPGLLKRMGAGTAIAGTAGGLTGGTAGIWSAPQNGK